MRERFWQFVHDKLEQAWHWVYYHKLARPLELGTPKNYEYSARGITASSSRRTRSLPRNT
jgi:hypothetical protein